jgi:predicted acetyltransferase
MHIRKLKHEEIDYSIQMSEFAFQLQLSEEQRKNRKKMINPEDTLVVIDDDKIVSKLTILPFKTLIQGKEFSMGGISGVVSWPEYRRSGLVKTLLKKSLEEMKTKGQSISFLFPFSIPFYRKYGWELFADKKLITMKKAQIPRFGAGLGFIRRIEKDFDLLNSIYVRYASQFNGMLLRDKNWWESRLFPNIKGQIAVYYDAQGEPEGYLVYDVKERIMKIQEFVYLSTEAWKSLWHFISNHDSMVDSIEYSTFGNDPALFFTNDPFVDQKIEPYFMARIVDVKQFLSMYPFDLRKGETLVLHVEDQFCEWNTGTFFINSSEVKQFQQQKEGAACTHPPKRGISCSIQSLTAMLLNYQKPSTLFSFEKIKGNENEITLLETAIPIKEPAFFDFF